MLYLLFRLFSGVLDVGWAVGSNGIILMKAKAEKTGVDDGFHSDKMGMDRFVLFQNYPNPFNASTTFRFQLMESSFIELKVYNLLGSEVATLVEGKRIPGEYEITWTTTNIPSGIYICRLEAKNLSENSRIRVVETRKIILQK